MSKSTPETDEFYAQIHRRMVESGEWDRCALVSPRTLQVSHNCDPRILCLLSSKLSEHGWVDEMRHRAKGCLTFLWDVERWADEGIHRTRKVDGYAFLSGDIRGDIISRTR